MIYPYFGEKGMSDEVLSYSNIARISHKMGHLYKTC